jgi:cytochrome P450
MGARAARFPLGAAVTFDELDRDPYGVYARLRPTEPISWLPALGMYYVLSHGLYRQVMLDDRAFTVGFPGSTVFETMGAHMMSVDGPEARRFKNAHRRFFLPGTIRAGLEPSADAIAAELIDGFAREGAGDLRLLFAARLPVLVMLDLLGLSREDEGFIRGFIDDLGAGLANTQDDAAIREKARAGIAAFYDRIGQALDAVRAWRRPGSLLDALAHAPEDERLTDEEIKRNAAIILFGGISTVESMVLNALHALTLNPQTLARVRSDRSLLPQAIDETVRLLGPVQTSHRHVSCGIEIAGISFVPGDIIACSQGAANHDPAVFPDPQAFDIDRPNLRQSVAFAHGPHLCLGMHLARAEGRIALENLLTRLPGLRAMESRRESPRGCEFLQPASFWAEWSQ